MLQKRIEEGIQKQDNPEAAKFLDMAADLELGISDRSRIDLIEVEASRQHNLRYFGRQGRRAQSAEWRAKGVGDIRGKELY